MIGVALLTAIFSFQQALSDTLFVSNEKSASLAVIDTLETQHWTVVSQRAAGKLSNGLALTPDGNALYVSNGGEGTMSELRLDQNEISRTSQIGHRPWGLASTQAPAGYSSRTGGPIR
jgi:DNA-binding beta-propeller fold protein YncE